MNNYGTTTRSAGHKKWGARKLISNAWEGEVTVWCFLKGQEKSERDSL